MDRKRGWISFILIFAFVILSFNLISAASCSITTSCAPDNTVMKLSSNNNAHGSLWNQGTYTYYLCCDFTGIHSCFSNDNNTVLRLSAPSNAHAEIPSLTNYPLANRVCFGNLSCMKSSSPCPSGYFSMVSLSADTNAHLGEFGSAYSTKICCKFYMNPLFCGDNIVTTPAEDCDGSNLNGASCLSLGYDGGTLACYAVGTPDQCEFNTAGCTTCGNNDVQIGEGCDDGNKNNGDCCSSTCTVEPGCVCVGDPSCCYDTTPGYSWLKNGVNFNSGGVLRSGDVLTMRFNEDFCKPSGAGTAFYIYEGATSRATSPSTVVSGLPGTTTSTYTAPLSFLQALGPSTSQILFRTTVDGNVYNSNTITVDTIYCGDGTCDSAAPDNENCNTCPADCGCNPVTQECSAGVCVGLCDLTSATWNYSTPVGSTIVAGTPVRLNLAGTNCNGKTISFEIREKDALGGGNSVTSNPSNIVFGASTYGLWTAEWQSEGFPESDPPEYYFIASVLGYSETIQSPNSGVSDNALLRVRQPPQCGINGCQTAIGENCLTCPADCGCSGATPVCDASGSCVAECTLTSKEWNVSSALDGQQVALTVYGTNCNGQTVNFNIMEYDALATDDPVEFAANPVTVVMSGGQATTRWFAEWPGFGDGETSPEYYFIPSISVLGKSITDKTPRLSVSQVITCPNGVINTNEDCDGSNLNGQDCTYLGPEYEGTLACASDCSFDFDGCYIPPCDITYVNWSVSTPVGAPVVEGTPVRVNVYASNCEGKTITFEVREKDGTGSSVIASTPSPILSFPSSGVAQSPQWAAFYVDDSGVFESNPPEYFVIASVQGEAESYTSSNSGVNDAALLRVTIPPPNCPNGVITAPETCDCGADGICTDAELDNKDCEDVAGPGYTGTLSCSGTCGFDVSGCIPPCSLDNAYWSAAEVVAGTSVRLNVEGSNCAGETITFEVFEDDGSFGDDAITSAGGTNPNPILSFPSSGNLGYIDWNAFYMPDNEIGQSEPPEFYFRATVQGSSPLEQRDSGNMNVLNAGACAGITYCSDYKTQGECDPDLCTAGENEPTCDETPTYDPITRCTTTPECDCQWVGDPTTGSCQPETIIGTPVCDNYACQPGVDECWLGGDACQVNSDSCTCEDGYNPNALGYCTPAHVCDPLTDICWLQGDLCTDECICQTGYTPNGDGTCGASNPNVCDPATDDCWLMGDKCQYDCTCEVGYTPNGLGYCDPIHVCDSLDECWILGNGCQDDCTCTNNDPDGSGGCMSGGSLPDLGESKCEYTTSGTDTCGEGVTVIERTIVGIMNWDPLNNFLSVPSWGVEGVNIFLRDGAYRYDPSNQYTECTTDRTQSIQCPATVELPFFGIYQVLIAIAIVGLIYLVYVLRKDDSKKSKSGRKYKKRK